MKLIDVDSKATLEDFLRKCNEKISGNKNELVLRASNANQVIYAYGANSSVDDDVKYDKDSVEDREYILPLISELNTGWSNKENFFTQISQMTMKK